MSGSKIVIRMKTQKRHFGTGRAGYEPVMSASLVPAPAGHEIQAPAAARLELKPTIPTSAWVDGAWWPRTKDLNAELPPLLSALFDRIGRVAVVGYHLDAWDHAERQLDIRSGTIVLQGFTADDPQTVLIIGTSGQRVTLVVVPSATGDAEVCSELKWASRLTPAPPTLYRATPMSRLTNRCATLPPGWLALTATPRTSTALSGTRPGSSSTPLCRRSFRFWWSTSSGKSSVPRRTSHRCPTTDRSDAPDSQSPLTGVRPSRQLFDRVVLWAVEDAVAMAATAGSSSGHTVTEIPVTAGVTAVIALPVTAVGALAAFVNDWNIEVQRQGSD